MVVDQPLEEHTGGRRIAALAGLVGQGEELGRRVVGPLAGGGKAAGRQHERRDEQHSRRRAEPAEVGTVRLCVHTL